MKKTALLAGLVLVVGFGLAHAEELKPIGKAKVCIGAGGTTLGQKLTMVSVEPANSHRVLIKFDDFDGSSWNGKVILHTVKGTDADQSQLYQSTEMKRPTIEVRDGSTLEVRPRGATADVMMMCKFVENSEVNPYEVINAYSADQKSK